MPRWVNLHAFALEPQTLRDRVGSTQADASGGVQDAMPRNGRTASQRVEGVAHLPRAAAGLAADLAVGADAAGGNAANHRVDTGVRVARWHA